MTIPANTDVRLLFATRIVRMIAYGLLSVILVLYLAELGISGKRIGLLLALTLVGDTIISLWLTAHADRLGRRRMLIIGAALMVLAGVVFAITRSWPLLLLAATIGVISPSGNEVGPFLSIEQASLSHVISAESRVGVFAWYNLTGSFATALGALLGGTAATIFVSTGMSVVASYRVIVLAYAGLGLVLAVLFIRVSKLVEVSAEPTGPPRQTFLGLHESRGIVFKLAALFAIDAFGGGFVIQGIIAYWFHLRFNVDPARLGAIFFGANVLAGLSSLLAVRMAKRFGLVNTMVFTHLPSNVLLILVPLMPSLWLAIFVLLLRFSISQMDVPTRQAYTMAVVKPDERSAAAGVTGVARTTGAAISPLIAGALLGSAGLLSIIFYLAGGLKIIYDILLYRAFTTVRLPEETRP